LAPTIAGGLPQFLHVPGHPELELEKAADETHWTLVDHSAPGGPRFLPVQANSEIHDVEGRVVGVMLPNGALALDIGAAAGNEDDNKPKFCPRPQPDKPGQG